MWKKSEQAPPNGVSMGDCKSNLIVFIRTPHKFGFVLKSSARWMNDDWWNRVQKMGAQLISNAMINTWQIDRRNRGSPGNFSDGTACWLFLKAPKCAWNKWPCGPVAECQTDGCHRNNYCNLPPFCTWCGSLGLRYLTNRNETTIGWLSLPVGNCNDLFDKECV